MTLTFYDTDILWHWHSMTLTFYDTDIPWHWQFRARMVIWLKSQVTSYILHSDIQYNKVCHITVQFQRFIYKIERHHLHMFEISGIDELMHRIDALVYNLTMIHLQA